MQKKPSTDNQHPSMEYIAGPIEVHWRADGVFGQDSPFYEENMFQIANMGWISEEDCRRFLAELERILSDRDSLR
jgi:aspartate aminotransferase-like enzyme